METLLLAQSDVRRLLTMELAVEAVEEAFRAHGRGETLMPAKVYLDLAEYDGDFRAMPAYFSGSAGVKWVNAHPYNPQRFAMPSVRGLYVLSDPANAQPLAVMDATWLTAARTGAAAAVATKYLARPDSATVGFIGTGVQARTLLGALRVVHPELAVVGADREASSAKVFAAEVDGRYGSLEEAAACDIVCTATPSTTPVVRRDWIAAGTHINAMGADGPGKQELDTELLKESTVVIDDAHQATSGGEVNVPLRRGELDEESIYATLGKIVAGLQPGRRSASEITVFDSTGLAIQDVAVGRRVYDAAVAKGIGQRIDFFA